MNVMRYAALAEMRLVVPGDELPAAFLWIVVRVRESGICRYQLQHKLAEMFLRECLAEQDPSGQGFQESAVRHHTEPFSRMLFEER